MPLFWVTFS